MENSLNSPVCSKIRKTYKKKFGHQAKASLDEAILSQLGTQNIRNHNVRNSLQHEMTRNSFHPKSNKKDRDSLPFKNKNPKKPNLKDLIAKHHRVSNDGGKGCYFTSTVTPNKSKSDSLFAKADKAPKCSEISKYKFVYQIGFGGFGKVWKVLKKKSQKEFAMKQICKNKVLEKDNVESILNERLILSNLPKHDFIINMHNSFQDKKNLYLVMDYLRGADLRYHICYKEKFNETEIKFIVACIIVGLQYIHKNQIIHRDIKPQNIVFEESGYLRITDFGIAKADHSDTLPSKFESSGTPGYMAPQILCKMPYSYESDFFALGVIIYELLMGKRPYEGNNRQEIRQNIINYQAQIEEQLMPKGFSKSAASFINGLLQRNPNERLGSDGFESIKNHSWLRDVKWKKLQKKQLKPPFRPNVVCETKQYLEQIMMYNQMHGSEENIPTLSAADQKKFEGYNLKKPTQAKPSTKDSLKSREGSALVSLNSSKMMKANKHSVGSTANFSNLLQKQAVMKRQRRNSQDRVLF